MYCDEDCCHDCWPDCPCDCHLYDDDTELDDICEARKYAEQWGPINPGTDKARDRQSWDRPTT